jgi:MoaA/NifB/PqqE/SkfB family radical SAM enzyme
MPADPSRITRLKVLADPPPPPSRVALISLTTFCNAACPFCCVLDILNRPELNPSDEKILERMAESRAEGCTILGFTGGEPTVHPRFAEFCRRGRELGYESITINTNGIQFKSRAWTEAALAAGLSHVDFSIHGDDDAMHDAMMARPGAFAAFRRGMAHLRELGPKYRPVLGATTVVTAQNAARLPAIAAMLVDEGIPTLRFKHCFEGAEGADAALVARYADLMGHVREAVRVARARGAMVTLTHFPLCLLGEEAVFATDLTEENILSINRDGAVLLDGRASDHRRGAASACAGCALAAVCTKLDERYVAVHGEAELRPVAGRAALRDFLERGLERHPGEPMAGHVRRLLGAPPAAAPDGRPPLLVSGSDSMNIGFISPTFRVLEMNWEHDYEMVKLGVPTIMGHLYRLGYRDLEHWDFDAQICEACAEDPAAFDLRQYFDQSLVTGFLGGTDDTLRPQTEKLLAVLGVTEKSIFGISLSAVLDRVANVMALAAVGQCLAKVLRERYPKSAIILGGLQASPDSTQPAIYQRIMQDCPAIDYAFVGQVEAITVQALRNIWSGEHARNRTLGPRVLYRADDGSVRFGVDAPDGRQNLGGDLLVLSGLRKGVPEHTNIGANAMAAAGGLADVSASVTVAAEQLMKRRSVVDGAQHVPAPQGSKASDFERTDLSAAEAGAHPYDTIPAAVPVFDPKLVEHFRYSGRQIMKRFHFDKETALRYSRFENDQIVVLPHIFIRGCNAPCGFCSYAYTKIEGEDLAQTVAGLRFLSETYNCKHFHFLNTQINSVYKYAEMFCDALVDQKLDILWSDCCNMRSLDEHLLEKMRKAGAMRLVFGVESPEDSMLRMINKGMNTETIERLLKASHELGIWNHVLLIAGMPHETKTKQDRIMEFLERTAHTTDFYSVSSYYLIATSPWGKNPEKFGIERITDATAFLEDQAFNEVPGGKWESDGLRWPEKKQQIVESTQRFYKTITRAKGQSRCVAGNIDLYLLMFLYSALGHDRKEEITRLYLQTAKTIFPGQGPEAEQGGEEAVARNRFRVHIPYILGRVNEADQFSQVNIPVDFDVLPLAAGQRGFAQSARYAFAWRSPALQTLTEEGTKQTRKGLADNLPQLVAQLTRMLGPFLQALDGRLAPTTAERMAELAALNLPRYKPFANEGYTVTGPATQRTIMERNLEWSGLNG